MSFLSNLTVQCTRTYNYCKTITLLLISITQELQAKTEQICEMAAVMAQAIHIDDQAIQQEQERMASIESENRGLRELLKISGLIPAPVKEEEACRPRQDTDSTTSAAAAE